MRHQIIGFTLGILLCILGIAELLPALVDWHAGHPNAQIFLVNTVISLFFGGSLIIANNSYERKISIPQAFMLTTLSWVLMSVFSAIPLYMSDLDISFTDAFFESVSGITTTGSTVLSGLDDMSYGVLLWRSMTQWIGGIGIIGLALVFLPFLKIGGMQLFRTESSDKSEKFAPRNRTIAVYVFAVYCGLTLTCTILYHTLGMSLFDALNHAMTTIPTGGYSTHDASFGYFDSPALQFVCSVFMFMGSIPFILYAQILLKDRAALFKDDQFKTFVAILIVLTVVMTTWLSLNSDYGIVKSLQYALFNIISVITTTGFATTDYTLWGPFAAVFFFFLTYMGACAGSTTGGIKTMRLIIAAKATAVQIRSLLRPNAVFTIRYQGKPVDAYVVNTVLGFLGLFVFANVALTLALTLVGLDFTSAISGAATALANVGPGIGDTIGPAGNFSSLPDSAKWLLCIGMLMGRLEILTVVVLFTKEYWKH